jgi:hypothetical protein
VAYNVENAINAGEILLGKIWKIDHELAIFDVIKAFFKTKKNQT